MAIAKGDLIRANTSGAVTGVVEINTAFENKVLNMYNNYQSFIGNTKTYVEEVEFWIRNGATTITDGLRYKHTPSETNVESTIKIYDSGDNLIQTIVYKQNDSDPETGVYTFPSSDKYKINVTQKIYSVLNFKRSIRTEIWVKPADIDILPNNVDKIRVYTSDYSNLDVPQKITVAVGESGLMTTDRGTDEAHGGT